MKKQYKKTMGAILTALSIAGVVHAENNMVRVGDGGPQTAAIIQELVNQGYLIPLNEENWYQINQEKLESLNKSNEQQRAAGIVDLLQSLVGPEVDVRNVDIFKARMSSQDYPSKAK